MELFELFYDVQAVMSHVFIGNVGDCSSFATQ